MKNPFEKLFSGKDKVVTGKNGEAEKAEYEKAHPEEVYKPGDIGKYRNKEDNIAVNKARINNPEINDVSELKGEELPETFIDRETREKEEQKATEELRNKIEQSLSK